jgi:hypothetical protein
MPIDLEFLGRQLELILNEQREIRKDIAVIKTRLTAIEGSFGLFITQMASFNARLDQLEERLGR